MKTYVFVTPKTNESKEICEFIQNVTIIAKGNSIGNKLDDLIRPQYGSIDFAEMPLNSFCTYFNKDSSDAIHISHFNVVEK